MTSERKTNAARAEAASGEPPREPGQRERNKIDKLRRIKDAARDLFVSKGFDDTTIREIAARAEVGLGTVFVYAANKRDLLFLIANDGLEDVARMAEACVSQTAPMLENLLEVCRHHYEFFARQPELSRLVLREMTFYGAGAQAAPFQRTREALIDLIGEIVRLAAAQKTITTSEAPQFVGWTIFCIYQVELRQWLGQNDLDVGEGLERLRRALTLMMSGLNPTSEALSVRGGTLSALKSHKAKRKPPASRGSG